LYYGRSGYLPRFFGLSTFLLLLAGASLADGQHRARVLEVNIHSTGGASAKFGRIDLSLADLRAMPRTEFRTTTIWTSGVQTFSGVSMAALFEELGVTSGMIELAARNDYRVNARVDDFTRSGALLAYEKNGMEIPARGKGPLWVVWNYDAEPALRTETIYSLSVWQLDRITISR